MAVQMKQHAIMMLLQLLIQIMIYVLYSTDLDECASCSGEQDGTGIIVDNDDDNDQVCNDD